MAGVEMIEFSLSYSQVKQLFHQANAMADVDESVSPKYQVRGWITEQKLNLLQQHPDCACFLVIAAGYEGIDDIMGLFTRQEAIELMARLRQKPHSKWTKHDQYCVQLVDKYGAQCVCGFLKVSPKETWWY